MHVIKYNRITAPKLNWEVGTNEDKLQHCDPNFLSLLQKESFLY